MILAFCVKPVKLIIVVWIEFVQQHEEFISIHLFKYLAKTWRTQEEQRKYSKTRNLCSIKYIVGNKFSVHAQFTIYQFKNCHQQRKLVLKIQSCTIITKNIISWLFFSHKPRNRLQITWWMGGEKILKKHVNDSLYWQLKLPHCIQLLKMYLVKE